ncbi:MAG: FtsX-like permease family protein [Bacteroidota bacterium]
MQVYVQIADDADMDQVSGLIKNMKLEKLDPEEARYKPTLFLDAMSKWHLYSEYKNGVNAGGKIRYVWMFGIIGFFVLLLACINFMNLGTARTEKRAKEVGIRKAIGSLRGQLVGQFFCESLLVTALAFVCSLVLVQLILPFFNEVANKKIALLWSSPLFWIAGILFTLITGLIAGSYPALYLSSFQPVRVLKGRFRIGRFAALPRKVLVIVQFTVSVTLIICTIVVFRQIQFAKDRPIGYSRDALITVPVLTNDITAHFDIVKDELLKKKVIIAMAASEAPVTDIWGSDGAFDWKGKAPELAVDFPVTGVSVDYGNTVDWEFKEGRNFSTTFATDSSALILNEAAVKYMALQHPVGENIKWKGVPYKVIGVINDVITESPYEPVRPSVFWLLSWQPNFIFLKINPDVSAAFALHTIETVFRQYNPSSPFDYSFADEDYSRKFGNEERVGKLAGFFAILAIFISCIGLFGMASFMAEQRIKEIGIRKVLGASVFNVWRLLSKEFVALVMISLLIAGPAAYYFMYDWLQNYSYRSSMSWWIFAAAGLGAMIITLLTISFHAVKAAVANPVKSLRTE